MTHVHHSDGCLTTADYHARQFARPKPDPDQVPEFFSAGMINRREARTRSLVESNRIANEPEAQPENPTAALRGNFSHHRINALEDAFCWLTSAAVLGYAVIGIIGL